MLFVFVEMVCLSAYRGRFYGGEWYLWQICLVILSLPLARHMKDLFFVFLILPLALLSEESQKTQDTGYPVEGVRYIFLQTKFIPSDNRFSFSEEGTTAFRVRFSFFGHHLFPRTPFIPCGFVITITYCTPLVLKGRSLYRY